jgi:hypothetical protein
MGKRGPDPKPESELRKHPVTCRLTDIELKQLDQGKPDGMSRGEWLRTKALKRKLPRAMPEVNREAYVELARLTANLNQYMRAVNQNRVPEPGPGLDLSSIYEAVQQLRRELIEES